MHLLKVQLEGFRKNPQVFVCYCSFKKFFPDIYFIIYSNKSNNLRSLVSFKFHRYNFCSIKLLDIAVELVNFYKYDKKE